MPVGSGSGRGAWGTAGGAWRGGAQRGAPPAGRAVEVHVDAGEVLGVIAQLDPPADEGGVDAVGVALERDSGGAGHFAGDRPAERFPQPVGVAPAGRAAPLEAFDRRLFGLGVGAAVGDLFGPSREPVV